MKRQFAVIVATLSIVFLIRGDVLTEVQDFPGEIIYPKSLTGASGSFNLNNTRLNAALEAVGAIVQAPLTGVIQEIGFLTGSVVTGDDLEMRIETVSGGEPSGTLWLANTNSTITIQNTDDDEWLTTSLTAGATVTAGDTFAVFLYANAGYVGDIRLVNAVADQSSNFPYVTVDVGGGWDSDAEGPNFSFKYLQSTYTIFPGAFAISSVDNDGWNSGDDPLFRGMRFKLPFPATMTGIEAFVDADGDATIRLFDTDGVSELRTFSISPATRAVTAANLFRIPSTAPVSLSEDVYYRLVYEPTTGTNIGAQGFSIADPVLWDSFSGGADVHFTSSSARPTQESDWGNNETKRTWLGIILSGFDDGTAEGGGGGETSATFVH